MPRTKQTKKSDKQAQQPVNRERLLLAPLGFEEAVSDLLQVMPDPKPKQRARQRPKKNLQKAPKKP
jgi:hypothetical protein